MRPVILILCAEYDQHIDLRLRGVVGKAKEWKMCCFIQSSLRNATESSGSPQFTENVKLRLFCTIGLLDSCRFDLFLQTNVFMGRMWNIWTLHYALHTSVFAFFSRFWIEPAVDERCSALFFSSPSFFFVPSLLPTLLLPPTGIKWTIKIDWGHVLIQKDERPSNGQISIKGRPNKAKGALYDLRNTKPCR